jgi:hypothetical protein
LARKEVKDINKQITTLRAGDGARALCKALVKTALGAPGLFRNDSRRRRRRQRATSARLYTFRPRWVGRKSAVGAGRVTCPCLCPPRCLFSSSFSSSPSSWRPQFRPTRPKPARNLSSTSNREIYSAARKDSARKW